MTRVRRNFRSRGSGSYHSRDDTLNLGQTLGTQGTRSRDQELIPVRDSVPGLWKRRDGRGVLGPLLQLTPHPTHLGEGETF